MKTAGRLVEKRESGCYCQYQRRVCCGAEIEGFVIQALPWTMEELLPDSLNADSVLADKRVRQAVEYAIDRPAIVKALGHGYWQALTQMANESVYGYDPGIEGRPYNPAKPGSYWLKPDILTVLPLGLSAGKERNWRKS